MSKSAYSVSTGQRSVSSNVRRLQDAINTLLQEEERQLFVSALNTYHTERNVSVFVKELKAIVNTPTKRKLIPLVRKVIPRADVGIFDQKFGFRPKDSVASRSSAISKSKKTNLALSEHLDKYESKPRANQWTEEDILRHIETTENTIRNSRHGSRRRADLFRSYSDDHVEFAGQPKVHYSSSEVGLNRLNPRHEDKGMFTGSDYDYMKRSAPRSVRSRSKSKAVLDKMISPKYSTLSSSRKVPVSDAMRQEKTLCVNLDDLILNQAEKESSITLDRGKRPLLRPPRKQHKVPKVTPSKKKQQKQSKLQTSNENLSVNSAETNSTLRSRKSTSLLTSSSSISSSISSSRNQKHIAPSSDKEQSTPEKEVLKIFLGPPNFSQEGFGFSIRGGANLGIAVIVSQVEEGGIAETKGLQEGDIIQEVNDISFHDIKHAEAVKIIKSARKLELVVCRSGAVPPHKPHKPPRSSHSYRWVDTDGRPTSPPPALHSSAQGDLSIHQKSRARTIGREERKVTLKLEEGDRLGLMIRGGREYGLGIYITDVDPGSLAHRKGLQVGHQIIEVNGQNFLDIGHAEAVDIIKTSAFMIMKVKDIGKLPLNKNKVVKDSRERPRSSRSRRTSGSSSTLTPTGSYASSSAFSKGAGSQLMLASMVHSNWDMIEELASLQLNDKEQSRLRYYMKAYKKGQLPVETLVTAMMELLNTHAKFTLMTEIRNVIGPADLKRFDVLVNKRHRDSVKAQPESAMSIPQILSRPSSALSQQAKSSRRRRKRPSSVPPRKAHRIETDLDLGPLRQAIDQIGDGPFSVKKPQPESSSQDSSPFPDSSSSSTVESDHHANRYRSHSPLPGPSNYSSAEERLDMLTKPSFFISPKHAVSMENLSHDRLFKNSWSASSSMQDVSKGDYSDQVQTLYDMQGGSESLHGIAVAEIHPYTLKPDINSPDDDSGVDLHSGGRHDNKPHDKVTISQGHPVDIHEVLSQRSTSSSSINMLVPASHGTWPSEEEKLILAAQEKYGIIPLEVISIHRSKPTLGLAIEGGANTKQPLPKVINVQAGGSAFESGKIRVGHVILEVNGQSLSGMNHAEVARLIAETFKDCDQDPMELLVTDSSVDIPRPC